MRLAIALVLCCLAGLPARAAADLDFRGMAVGLWNTDPHARYADAFADVRALGANAVLFTVLAYVDNIDATTVYRLQGMTVPDATLERAIDDARAAGLRVALMPVVRIERRTGTQWRGQLTPADRDAFFASYRRMLVYYAKLAAAHDVELFLVGSELASLEDAPHWSPLIARVREVYPGLVSYSANWDHYEQVPFWDELDALALTGYYELSATRTPTQAELTARWHAIRDHILAWRARYPDKRLLFTEVGYPAQDGCAMTPWDYTLDQPVDIEEQRMCYRAFVDTWRGDPALAGVFFYEWWGAGGPGDRGYTPRGKPAARLVRAFFTADAPAAAPAE